MTTTTQQAAQVLRATLTALPQTLSAKDERIRKALQAAAAALEAEQDSLAAIHRAYGYRPGNKPHAPRKPDGAGAAAT
jgi:hypothetical protein